MKKNRNYEIHKNFLNEYENAALLNAQHLLNDAKILLVNESIARTYFLAVASIEETGKAYLAFSCKQRNLNDEGLKNKLKTIFESHPNKIGSAFIGWISRASNQEEAIEAALELISNLKLGREVSMYVDVNQNNEISIPMHVIRPVAAVDSVKVAENCLYHTRQYLSENEPPTFSKYEDKMFCFNTQKIAEIFKISDFGDYCLDEIKANKGNFNFPKIIVTYHDNYYCKKVAYKKENG